MDSHLPLRIVAVAILTSLTAFPVQASTASGATVTQVQKDVSSAGATLKSGDTPASGAPVVTGANSRAELKLASGTTVRIGQGSSFSFDGGNLALRQGSALFKLAGGKARITTPSLGCTAGSGVISTHAAKNYEACFVIEGSATVNGVALKTGEGYVRENGSARKLAFDVQRMLDTSFLVTKFPKTPWVVQAFAAAAIQSELLAANRAQSALLSGRAPVNAAAAGKGRAASAPAISEVRGSQVTGVASSAVASNAVSGVSGGTLSVNSWSSSSAGVVTTAGGTLSLGGSSTYSGGIVSGGTLITNANPINLATSGNTVPLVLTTSGNTSGTTVVGGSAKSGTVLVGNPGTLVSGGTVKVNNGVLTLNGAGTGVLNVNGGALSSGAITTSNGVVIFGNGTAQPITTLRSVPSKR